jgi:hypothetical protein
LREDIMNELKNQNLRKVIYQNFRKFLVQKSKDNPENKRIQEIIEALKDS